MEPNNKHLDKIDIAILKLLIKDSKIPYTEIAERLLISPGTVHVRMKKMEKEGIVRKFSIELDPVKLGFDLTAFVGVYLEKGSIYKEVILDLLQIPEITEAHYTTGNYSVFMKIVCRNTNHLRQVINDKIQAVKGIQRTETIISLEESIKRQVAVDKALL
jgi:Lrp/AsnC family transcriptional regulator for asnA, asnC and gidA